MFNFADLLAVSDSEIPSALERLGHVAAEVEKARASLWSRLLTARANPEQQASSADDEPLTVPEVAAMLKASETFVRNHRTELGGWGGKRMLRFHRSKVEAWQRKHRGKTPFSVPRVMRVRSPVCC